MNFSRISDSLIIGSAPTTQDYDLLRQMGVRLVINMRVERRPDPDPHNPPITVLWLPVFDTPLIPIPIKSLRRGVAAALETIQQGGKVYAHCQEGIHRGVAMGAAILIAQGYSPQQAIELIKQLRPIAEPDAWYIKRRIFSFAKSWQPDPSLQ
jgi:protein-tyrosine phosphatase